MLPNRVTIWIDYGDLRFTLTFSRNRAWIEYRWS